MEDAGRAQSTPHPDGPAALVAALAAAWGVVVATWMEAALPPALAAWWGRPDYGVPADGLDLVVHRSGALATLLLAGAAWWVARRRAGRPDGVALAAWAVFAVTIWEFILTLAGSSLSGVGAWALALEELPRAGILRASLAAAALFVAGQLVRGTIRTLAAVVGNGVSAVRARAARRVGWGVWVGAFLAGSVAGALSATGSRGAAETWWAAAAWGALRWGGSAWVPRALAGRVADHPVPGAPLVPPGALSAAVWAALLLVGLALVWVAR